MLPPPLECEVLLGIGVMATRLALTQKLKVQILHPHPSFIVGLWTRRPTRSVKPMIGGFESHSYCQISFQGSSVDRAAVC